MAMLLALLLLVVPLAHGVAPFSTPPHMSSKHPAFSVLTPAAAQGGLVARLGTGEKSSANPLFTQELPWEQRIDNGYASMVYDPSHTPPWRLWYDAFVKCNDNQRDDQGRYLRCGGGKREHAALYAESVDGLRWQKPALNLVGWDTTAKNRGMCCTLKTKACGGCRLGEPGVVPTNIWLPESDGTGVTHDVHEANASLRYKAVGNNLPLNFGVSPPAGSVPTNRGGVCGSPDGVHYKAEDCQWLSFSGMHWDCWSNIFYDSRTGEYIGTMRASNPNPCAAAAPPGQEGFYPRCMDVEVKAGKCSAADCVRNGRTMSRYISTRGDWRTLGQGPGANQAVEHGLNGNNQLYVQATFPYYGAYLGVLMVYNAATARQEVHCELAWSNDTLHWHRIEPGHDLVPQGPEGSFESHIVYGSIPVEDPATGVIREYYFGGDGPHFGVRNSSLGLSEFRASGLAGVGAEREWVWPVVGDTVPLKVTGRHLVVTADTDTVLGENNAGMDLIIPNGSVAISVAATVDGTQQTMEPLQCDVLTGHNVTDMALDGCDFSHLIGQEVVLTLRVSGGALLYTVGFSADDSTAPLAAAPAPPQHQQRRQLEEAAGGLLDDLCAEWKSFPAFQAGRVAARTGELTAAANLTGIDAISQGVCTFGAGMFVTASDDAWQENQLFIADIPTHDASPGGGGGGSVRVLNISRLSQPYRGKVQLGALLGIDSTNGILALIEHDTFNPDPSADGDVWSDLLGWIDVDTGVVDPIRNVSTLYDRYGDTVDGVNAFDVGTQTGYVYTIGFSDNDDERERSAGSGAGGGGCGGGGGGCLVGLSADSEDGSEDRVVNSSPFGVLGITHSPLHKAIFALAWTQGGSGDTTVLRLDDNGPNSTSWQQIFTFPHGPDWRYEVEGKGIAMIADESAVIVLVGSEGTGETNVAAAIGVTSGAIEVKVDLQAPKPWGEMDAIGRC
jgi:hypothetical protein